MRFKMVQFLTPTTNPAIDPNSHYYFFTGIMVALTAAASVVSAIVVAVQQFERSRRQWSYDRIEDLARYAAQPDVFRQLARTAGTSSEFTAQVNQIVDGPGEKDFPEGPTKARLWALDAGRTLQEVHALGHGLPLAVFVSLVTILGCLAGIVSAPGLAKCQTYSFAAWIPVTVAFLFSLVLLYAVARLPKNLRV
jgi:hypothetical protein